VATQLWAITLSTLASNQLAIATRAILSDRSYSVVNYRRTLKRATMDINTCDCVKLTECSSYAQSVEHTMMKGTLH